MSYHIVINFKANTAQQCALVLALRKCDRDFPYIVSSEGKIIPDPTRKCDRCKRQIYRQPYLQMSHILNGNAQFKANIKIMDWLSSEKCTFNLAPIIEGT